MARKGENIRKRKDGRWEGRYLCGERADGSKRYASVYAHTYTEVRGKLAQAKVQGKSERAPTAPHFEAVLKLWLQSNRVRLKGATQKRYQNLIDSHIAPELGAYRLDRLNTAVINDFLNRKLTDGRLDGAGGLSPAYVRAMAVVISSALRFAYAAELMSEARIAVHKPALKKSAAAVLDRSVQVKIEAYATEHPSPTGAGILLALYAGLRIGEVCALRWSDIDFHEATLRVRHTIARVPADGTRSALVLDTAKTRASCREIPIVSKLLRVLTELHKHTRSAFVVSDSASFVSPRTFDYRFRRVLQCAGVPPVNFHALRHTFATRCVESDVDVKTLSELLGHANAAVTLNTYVHSSFARKREQLEQLCGAFA